MSLASVDTRVAGAAAVEGLMQDYPLTLHHIFWRLERLFGHKAIVTQRDGHVHRYTNSDLVLRVYRLANALQRLGCSRAIASPLWPGTITVIWSCTTRFRSWVPYSTP